VNFLTDNIFVLKNGFQGKKAILKQSDYSIQLQVTLNKRQAKMKARELQYKNAQDHKNELY
jgi:hypothetical protein